MKNVFVVYGRTGWSDGVFDQFDQYFGESVIYGVFETFENALIEFKKRVKEAHEYFADGAPLCLNEDAVKKAIGANLFENYNMDKDEYNEGDVKWEYVEYKDFVKWQMYPVNVDIIFNECPILAGIYLRKQEVNP